VPGTGNFSWLVNDFALIEGEQYEMFLQNADSGGFIDIGTFVISGNNNPQNCDFIVTDELDGDYRIRFYVDNNNDCHTNVEYDVDYGDGQTTNFTNSSNTFSFAHQYPFGTYGVYNVTVDKKDSTTGNILGTQLLSVAAKRD